MLYSLDYKWSVEFDAKYYIPYEGFILQSKRHLCNQNQCGTVPTPSF